MDEPIWRLAVEASMGNAFAATGFSVFARHIHGESATEPTDTTARNSTGSRRSAETAIKNAGRRGMIGFARISDTYELSGLGRDLSGAVQRDHVNAGSIRLSSLA